MTVSQWKAYGKLHGYWGTFEKEVREKENIAFLNGERCTMCGGEKEFSKHSETCKKMLGRRIKQTNQING